MEAIGPCGKISWSLCGGKIDFIEDSVDFRGKDRALFAQDWPERFKTGSICFCWYEYFRPEKGQKTRPFSPQESPGQNSSQREVLPLWLGDDQQASGQKSRRRRDFSIQAGSGSPCQIKIVKPSRDCVSFLSRQQVFFQWKRLVFTHSFDHPLGQAGAAFWAESFYKIRPCFFETGALACLSS